MCIYHLIGLILTILSLRRTALSKHINRHNRPLSKHINRHNLFVNNSKSRNLWWGKLFIYLSIILGSYVVIYLRSDGLNLKMFWIIQLILGSWRKIFPLILGNMADNADLATAVVPYFWSSLWKRCAKNDIFDKWHYMDL